MNAMTPAQLRKQAEDLKAQAEAIEAKAKEEERERKRQALLKEAEEEAKKQRAERQTHVDAVIAAIKDISLKAAPDSLYKVSAVYLQAMQSSYGSIKIDDRLYSIDFSYEQKGWGYSKWDDKKGRQRIAVGPYGDRKSYPQKKDGTFNYAGIADQLLNEHARHVASMRVLDQRGENEKVVGELLKELGYEDREKCWSLPFEASEYKDKAIKLRLSSSAVLNADKVRRIIPLWKQIQSIINEKE